MDGLFVSSSSGRGGGEEEEEVQYEVQLEHVTPLHKKTKPHVHLTSSVQKQQQQHFQRIVLQRVPTVRDEECVTHFLLRSHDIIILTIKGPASDVSRFKHPLPLSVSSLLSSATSCVSQPLPLSLPLPSALLPPAPSLPPPAPHPPPPPPIKEKHVGCKLLVVGLDFSESDLNSQHV